MQFAILGKKTPNGNLQFFFYWLLAIPFFVLYNATAVIKTMSMHLTHEEKVSH